MKKDGKFNCVIVGGGTLPIRCAEILLSKNQEICAIVSSDAEVRNWASERKVAYLTPGANLAELLSGHGFDYLFSIVNEHILREDVLSLPRKLAVNYHDAMLPRYAGTHATSWALINGETSHGITWHVITDVVDAGDVLKQERVEISADDTALTLNTKCYESAIKAFAQLVDELAAETVAPEKQNLEERTFFPRFKRPPNGCVISWNNRAADISALVRALNFGNNPNPLGSAKLTVKDEFFIVDEIKISGEASKNPPGTISKIAQDFIQISTVDDDVVIRKISRFNGQSITISEFTADFDLREGFQFAELTAETAGRLQKLYTTVCKHEAFWVKKLASLEPAVPPYVNTTVSSDTAQYEKIAMRAPDEVLNLLKEPQTNWKVGDFLLASFGLLLGRLGEAEGFDVGYKDIEIQDEVGGLENFFTAQLPLRVNVDGLQTFVEFFKSVQEQLESLKKHKTYTKDLTARYPQLHKIAESGKLSFPVSIEITKRLEDYQVTESGDLTLVISESESECLMIYNGERIKSENAEKLISHFTTLLKGIAANPGGQTAYLPLLTEKEKHQLLVEWNGNAVDYPKNVCINQLFETQVSRTPDAVALIFGEQRLTYRELNRRANQLASHLQTLGVKPETLVGICIERSVEMIVAVLAVHKAGGAYIPLDPNYPLERLALMLEDSQVSVLLTKQKLAGGLNQQNAKVVCVDTDGERIAQESAENPASSSNSNNLSHVIYTSGSTGRPKGVAIEHRSVIALLTWAVAVFKEERLKRVLASTSICFDLSVYEIFAPLICGGAIVLVENVLHLPHAPAANEVTLINTVPSAIAELLRIKGVPSSVRTVNLAGEPLKTSLVRQIYETNTVREVFDLYGPTEDTTYSTFTLRDNGAANIGRPLNNTQAYILDRHLQLVPAGIPGELYLGGDGLARGYLNRPEMTAERFVPNPFNDSPSARIYKTGDLVRYLPDGRIEYLGRIDNQVKIRGFRIELGEIEAVLQSHQAVREAVVVARDDSAGAKQLVAYLVPNQELRVKTAELRDYLKQKLPNYMIPAAFVELPEFPLTPNGKVDRKALPAPSATIADADRMVVSHRDSLEEQITKIWETILGVHPIGINDDFFELGGHSLKAVRMFAEIEKVFNKNIPLATLFEAGTVEKLAGILRQDGWDAPESSLVPIQPKGTKTPFFCVHAKGGNVLFYRDLAKYMGTERPFYGIQARRLGGRQVGHSSVEEMADFYIKEIKTVQPEGPYYLGGSSFGGLVAFEIAQRLRAQGDEIAFVALLDTGTPDYPKYLPTTSGLHSKFYTLVRRLQHHRDSLTKLNSKQRIEYVTVRLGKVKLKYRRKIRDNYKKLVRKFYAARNLPVPKTTSSLKTKSGVPDKKYVPQVYEGDVTLFRATHQPLGIYPDPTLGWEGFVAGELEIHDVEGHHGSIVAEPYVRSLAEKMLDCLEKIESEERQSVSKTKPVVKSQSVELSY